MIKNLLIPQWQLPVNVRACFSTRVGGISKAPFNDLNLANHVGDDSVAVQKNRQLISQWFDANPAYLQQTHTINCIDLDDNYCLDTITQQDADASLTSRNDIVCCVMVADCLPVLFCTTDGKIVAAAHAGWRGLVNGVLEQTIKAIRYKQQLLNSKAQISAWLGPCIGVTAFRVGEEVRQQFLKTATDKTQVHACFQATEQAGFYLANLAQLARLRLQQQQIELIFGNDASEQWCTYNNEDKFFSYRRDQQQLGGTGRMAAYIKID